MSNVLALPSNRLLVEAVAIVRDRQGRVLLTHPGSPDLWALPRAQVDSAQTPNEAIRSVLSTADVIDGAIVGVWSTPAPDERLIVGYRFHLRTTATVSGLLLPLGLLPLNTDPRHLAIARHVIAGSSLKERLEECSGLEHLSWLRKDEGRHEYTSLAARAFLEAVASERAQPDGVHSGRYLALLAEAMIAAGERHKGRQVLEEAIAVGQGDDVTLLKCELRLEELSSDDGILVRAWSRLSQATGEGGRHMDVILAHLGYAADRRGRFREAEAYMRRALAVCEEPERRAALRHRLALRPMSLVSVSA